MRSCSVLVGVAMTAALMGCGAGPGDPGENVGEVQQEVKPPTQAPCTILVKGVGQKSIEDDYLPHVITCWQFCGRAGGRLCRTLRR